jgi:hypothetical protein
MILKQQGDFSASPESKLTEAQALLAHAEEYEPLIRHPPSAIERARAERFQREEREAAAMLMRTAAEDYVNQQDIGRARTVYRSLLDVFPETDYGAIHRGAQSALNYLEEGG